MENRCEKCESISVITPSYNQGVFLSECLESVKKQTLQPIEHLVYDPGSDDDSRDIASSFDHVTLIAEDDNGQSDALNKGFSAVKGDIIGWVNSDDYFYDEGVFKTVIDRFNQDDQPDIVYGKGLFVDEHGGVLRDVYVNKDPDSLSWRLQQECGILQPALFMRRNVIKEVGLLRTDLHYCMDYEFWIRCVKNGVKFVYIDQDFANFRFYTSNKTYGSRGDSYREVATMLLQHYGYVHARWLKLYAEYKIEKMDGVLETPQNTKVDNPNDVENEYRRLLRAYNLSHDTQVLLKENPNKFTGIEFTKEELRQRDLIRDQGQIHQIENGITMKEGCAVRAIGERTWATSLLWRKNQFEKSHSFLREEASRREKEVCVVVGNGPSLKKIDLNLLKDQDVIISNNAFLSPELLKYATYYTVVNYLVAEQSFHHINQLELIKIIPYWLSYAINEDVNTYFIEAKGFPEFSTNIYENVSWRHTVTFYNLQIAYGLGYKKVVMVGFDHSYKQKADVKEGDIILSDKDDDNHFHSSYFKGKKWQAADVNKMEEMYMLAKDAFENDNREIVNSTVGGKLEIFNRQTLADALK